MTDNTPIPIPIPIPIKVEAWYDTRNGLEARLKNGLDGLREIIQARSEAGYNRGERMAQWCLLGRYHADTCGNVSKITKGSPAAMHFLDPGVSWVMGASDPGALVLSQEEMQKHTQGWVADLGTVFPAPDALCDRCGKGWSLGNIHTFIQREGVSARHEACVALALADRHRKEFVGILERAEIPYTDIFAIPNEYAPVPEPLYDAPWFMVETSKGRLKIGWRKRVINIDWSGMSLDVKGVQVVSTADVTYGPTYAHAWGGEEAVNVLRLLWSGGRKEWEPND